MTSMLRMNILIHSLNICQDDTETHALHFQSTTWKRPKMLIQIVLRVIIPPEASEMVGEGQELRIGIEFSLENPDCGMHFLLKMI